MPLVVAIIAVRNAEHTIGAAVKSLLSQSLDDLGVIVVDNKSTDGTAQVVDTLMQNDKRISLQTCSIPGPFFCRNQAMKDLDCEFMAVMDGDDISSPLRFELQIEALNAKPHLAAVGSRIVFFGDKIGMPEMASSEEECRESLSLFNPCCHPSLMVRRSALNKAGLYNEEYKIGGDFDFVRRLSYQGGIENIQQPLLLYRIHDSQITSQKKKEQGRTAISVLRKHHEQRLKINKISNQRLLLEMSKAALLIRTNLKRQALRSIRSCVQTMLTEETA